MFPKITVTWNEMFIRFKPTLMLKTMPNEIRKLKGKKKWNKTFPAKKKMVETKQREKKKLETTTKKTENILNKLCLRCNTNITLDGKDAIA